METGSDSEDDEVEHEMDVLLSKRLQGKLYLLQYPVRRHQKPFGPNDRISAKIKPKNAKLEMDIALNISSPSYKQSKGEQIAMDVDGNDSTSKAPTFFDTNVMDKQTLHSMAVPSAGKRYVCGIIQDGRVHLTPISNVLQLRPGFKYMDHAEHRAALTAKAKEAAEADSSQDEADDAKAVTVRLKGAETEDAKLARERSYAAYEKRLADEKWQPLKFYSSEHSVVELERRKLLCMNSPDSMMGSSIPDVVRTPMNYLNSLRPVYSTHAVDNTAMPENVLSVSLLKNETLGNQIKLIMKNANIIHFSHLLSLLPGSPDRNTVAISLQSYAVLIRGCWIVKSEVLFPPDTVSPISGTQAENLCRSRNYILYMFTVKEFLSRKEVTAAVKIPSEDVKAILDDIAVMRVGHGWKLRLNSDSDFCSRHPQVVQRQNLLWKALGVKLAKIMNLPHLLTEADMSKSTKADVVSSSRKKNSSTSGDEKSSKTSKSAKKQRKPSGAAANSSTKVKPEPTSPTHARKLPFVQLNGEGQLSDAFVSNGKILPPFSTILSPSRLEGTAVLPDLGGLPDDINIDNVNSTVQSIANEIYKTNTPNRVQSFVPQPEDLMIPTQMSNDVYVKQEKKT